MAYRILIVHNQYSTRGGEERVISEQTKLLQSRGHEVQFYFEDSQAFARRNIFLKLLSAVQTSFSVWHYFGLKRAIRRFNPDIVHFHNVFPLLTPSVYYAAKKEKKPIVQSLHNYRFLCANGLFLLPNGTNCERCLNGSPWNALRFNCYGGGFFRTLAMTLNLSIHRSLKTFKKCIDFYIAPSSFLKRKLLEAGYQDEKLIHISPSISYESAQVRHCEEKTIVYIGRLSREKGLRTLLAAAENLPDWTFKLVGGGTLEEELRSLAVSRQLKNVEFFGHQNLEHVHAILKTATYLIIPSECYENMPTVILEAWSYAVPVIASRLGSMAEAIKEGQNGFLFEPGNPQDLEAVIRRLTAEISRGMSDSIYKHFQKNHGQEAYYRNLLNIYERATKNT